MPFFHGIKVNEPLTGTRPIVGVATAVIGIVCTGPSADVTTFPLNKPVLVTDVRAALGKAGTDGTLPVALAGIADQASPIVIVVRVTSGAGGSAQADTNTAVIGATTNGVYTGAQALLAAEAQIGIRPRILAAPDLSKLGTVFGDQQAQAALRPLIQKIGEYRRIRAEAAAATGTVDADFAQRMGDTQSKWDRLAATFQRIKIAGGRNTEQATGPMLDWLTAKGDRFAAWIEQNRSASQRLGDIWRLAGSQFAAIWRALPAYQAGRAVSDGLTRGIKSGAISLWQAGAETAQGLIARIKAKLGIRSPSRVMAAIGGYTMQGLDAGIARGQAAPVRRATAVAARLASALAVGAAAPTLASGGSASPGTGALPRSASAASRIAPTAITIHVHQLPGEDGAALARRVASELHDRAAIARRSSYEDD